MHKRSVFKPCLCSVVTGLAVGAAVGVLTAPCKGKHMRRKMLRKGHHAMKSCQHGFDNVKDGFDDLMDKERKMYKHMKRRFC